MRVVVSASTSVLNSFLDLNPSKPVQFCTPQLQIHPDRCVPTCPSTSNFIYNPIQSLPLYVSWFVLCLILLISSSSFFFLFKVCVQLYIYLLAIMGLFFSLAYLVVARVVLASMCVCFVGLLEFSGFVQYMSLCSIYAYTSLFSIKSSCIHLLSSLA